MLQNVKNLNCPVNCSEIGHVTRYEMRETSYGSANNGGVDQQRDRKQATRELTRGFEFDKLDDFNANVGLLNYCFVVDYNSFGNMCRS